MLICMMNNICRFRVCRSVST